MADGDDIKIKVGTEVSTGDASKKILAEFDRMTDLLATVGTESAEALSKQLEEVSKGLSEGLIKPDDVAAVAADFERISKYSELSDEAISNFTRRMDGAVEKSRSLSDYMHSAERTENTAGGAMEKLRGLIGKVSAGAENVSRSVGDWIKHLPGANGLITKMGAGASAIALGFTAVAAAVLGAVAALKSFNQEQRNALERSRRIRAENATNANRNTLADIDTAAAKRASELENTKAMIDLENELKNIRERNRISLENENEILAERRKANIEMVEYEAKLREIEKDRANIEAEGTESANRAEDIQSKIDAQRKLIEELEKQRSDAQDDMAKYDGLRSQIKQDAEASQMLKDAGIDIDDPSAYEKIRDASVGWLGDKFSNIKAFFTGGESTEEANTKYEAAFANERSAREEIKNARRSIQALEVELQAEKANAERINVRKQINDEQTKEENNRVSAIRRERSLEFDNNVATKINEKMASGNRLTALGLGGGISASPTKDIAKDTKHLSATLDDIRNMINADGRSANGRELKLSTSPADWALQ